MVVRSVLSLMNADVLTASLWGRSSHLLNLQVDLWKLGNLQGLEERQVDDSGLRLHE